MLGGARVLIVEDEALIAFAMAEAVKLAEGVVVGPLGSVNAALKLLEVERVAAAILDANLLDRDITPVALLLARRGIPAVVYTGVGLPAELRRVHPDFPVVIKPEEPTRVVRKLAELMGRTPLRGS